MFHSRDFDWLRVDKKKRQVTQKGRLEKKFQYSWLLRISATQRIHEMLSAICAKVDVLQVCLQDEIEYQEKRQTNIWVESEKEKIDC